MYPRWLTEPLDDMNLREVAPGLYVGAERATLADGWHTVIDLYGSRSPAVVGHQRRASHLLRLPFEDGQPFPPGALDAAWDAWQRADVDTVYRNIPTRYLADRMAHYLWASFNRHALRVDRELIEAMQKYHRPGRDL